MQAGIRWWVGISAGLMVIGGFGAWATVLGISVDGTKGDGWLVIGAAAFGAGLAYAMRGTRWAGVWAIVGGVVGLGVTAYDRSHLESIINNAGALAGALLRVGWGLNLALIASISMAIAGAVGVMQGPAQPAAVPASTAEPSPSSVMAGPETAAGPPASAPE